MPRRCYCLSGTIRVKTDLWYWYSQGCNSPHQRGRKTIYFHIISSFHLYLRWWDITFLEFLHSCANIPLHTLGTGLIQVKGEGWTGFSKSWKGCSEGFPEGEAQGKSRGAALPALGKPRPFRLFYLE